MMKQKSQNRSRIKTWHQTLLNNTASFVTDMSSRTSTRTWMEEIGWLDLRELMEYHSVVSLWKVVWLSCPMYIQENWIWHWNWKYSNTVPRLQNTITSYRWRASGTNNQWKWKNGLGCWGGGGGGWLYTGSTWKSKSKSATSYTYSFGSIICFWVQEHICCGRLVSLFSNKLSVVHPTEGH